MDEEKYEKKDSKEDAKEQAMLRAAVHYTVYKISEECASKFDIRFTKEMVLAIADHMFRNMEVIGRDLELFARHAKRTKINPDDVKLLFRHSPNMAAHLDDVLRLREQEKREARAAITVKAADSKTPKSDRGKGAGRVSMDDRHQKSPDDDPSDEEKQKENEPEKADVMNASVNVEPEDEVMDFDDF